MTTPGTTRSGKLSGQGEQGRAAGDEIRGRNRMKRAEQSYSNSSIAGGLAE